MEAQSLVDGGTIKAEVRVENMLHSRHHNLTYVDAPMGVTQFIGGHATDGLLIINIHIHTSKLKYYSILHSQQ